MTPTILGCPRKLGPMVCNRIVYKPTYKWGKIGVITHLLTIDPNFRPGTSK